MELFAADGHDAGGCERVTGKSGMRPAAFARELARLVGAGIRVVMTTHSEWFLEQIGNLVRLSTLSEKKRDGIEGADVALHPDDVGAWLFKPSEEHKGSVVEEVVLDPDTGLYSTDLRQSS